MEKCDVAKLISTKSPRVTFTKCKGSSNDWPHFERIEVNEEFCEYVRCVACRGILKWKSRDETSGLKAQRQSRRVTKNSDAGIQNITSMPGFSAKDEKQKLSVPDRNPIKDVQVKMCATDLQ